MHQIVFEIGKVLAHLYALFLTLHEGTQTGRNLDVGTQNAVHLLLELSRMSCLAEHTYPTNMRSHLQRKLFEEDGIYHPLWIAMQDDAEVTAVVRSRQLHTYRNGKKILVFAGKAAPKVIREDILCEMIQQ